MGLEQSSLTLVFEGYCGLGASVAALGLATSSPIEVDLLASCCNLHSLCSGNALLTAKGSAPLLEHLLTSSSRQYTVPVEVWGKDDGFPSPSCLQVILI